MMVVDEQLKDRLVLRGRLSHWMERGALLLLGIGILGVSIYWKGETGLGFLVSTDAILVVPGICLAWGGFYFLVGREYWIFEKEAQTFTVYAGSRAEFTCSWNEITQIVWLESVIEGVTYFNARMEAQPPEGEEQRLRVFRLSAMNMALGFETQETIDLLRATLESIAAYIDKPVTVVEQ